MVLDFAIASPEACKMLGMLMSSQAENLSAQPKPCTARALGSSSMVLEFMDMGLRV